MKNYRIFLNIPFLLSVLMFGLQMATAGRYGFFGDELYYMACGKHLAFGYVDHPPFVALIARISLFLFGGSILGFRFWSALAGALTVWLTARLSRELTGDAFAQGLAALMILVSSVLPALFSFMSMNAFDVLICTVATLLLMKIVQGASKKTWLFFGLIVGIGLMNKYTMLVFGFAVFVGLLATQQRVHLRSPWPYLAGLIGLAIFLPHIIWQVSHGWPTWEFMKNAQAFKNVAHSPVGFLLQMILTFNPIAFPVWMSGLVYLLFGKATAQYRFLGIAAVVFLIVYITQNSKVYYVVPILPLLLASGSVSISWLIRHLAKGWLRPAMIAILIAGGAVLLPLGVPLLPADRFIRYSKAIGIWKHVKMEKGQSETLPLHFVYRFGWEALVQQIADVYHNLPDEERAQCGILASWYGIAGAVDHFGPEFGLPNAICGRNNYWLWGPGDVTGETVLTVGFHQEDLKRYFHTVEKVATFEHPYAYNQTICICKDSVAPLRELWPKVKTYL
jgi:4-amino-4-deoxy-L-arabinose transferase-like glycosyltransferase